MGQSLAVAAVRGMQSDQTIAEQKQSLLSAGDTEGLISLNHSLFGSATMMAKEDDDADDDDDDADDGDDPDDDDDDSDDDDDDDDDDKGKKRKPDPKDERIKELSAEAKKKRLRIRKDRQRIADLEAENARLKGKKPAPKKDDDKDDDEDDQSSAELEAEKAKNKALEERLVRQTLRSEFNDLITGDKPIAQFIDPKAAFRLLDLDDVEIDEDGDIDGLDDAIKELAERAPYLLKTKAKAKDDEDDEDDEDEEKPGRRKTGQRTGGGRRKRGEPNKDKLVAKYPALRR